MRALTWQLIWLAATALLTALAAAGGELSGREWPKYLLFAALHLAAHKVPVAFPRARAVHLTPVTVFASVLSCQPMMAASLAMAASLPGRVLSGSRDLYGGLLGGAELAFASLAAGLFYGLLGPGGLSDPLEPKRLGGLLGVSVAFMAAHTLASLATYPLQRGKGAIPLRSFLLVELWIYTVSIPFAILMLFTLKYVGIGGALLFVIPAVAGAEAVRTTIEVRLLRRQLASIEAISQGGIAEQSEEEVMRRFLKAVPDILRFDVGSIWLVEGEEGTLALARTTARPREETVTLSPGEGAVGRAALSEKPLILHHRKPESCRDRSVPHCPSALLIPLVARGKVLGVAAFESRMAHAYRPIHYQRVRSLTHQLAVSLENVRLHARMEEIAVTDGLTGLLNHRRLQEALADELRRADRYRYPVSVVMIDVDSFKHYNDTYGHPQGDVLLKTVARLLYRTVRQVDYVGRYGGEEFMVVLPQTNKAQALFTAERLRLAVAEH
ncbi:MAG: GGDEF domain-containing protein, partial [Armatimonadetes bacterium]|nr:GGDEF domain-containing protein [Armatimonadota bacterium]